MHALDHLSGREIGPRFELTKVAPAGHSHLHVAPTDVDGKHSLVAIRFHLTAQQQPTQHQECQKNGFRGDQGDGGAANRHHFS